MPVVGADVVEAGELHDQPLHEPVTAGVHGGRAVSHEAVRGAAVALRQRATRLVEDLDALVGHGDLDVAAEHGGEVIAVHRGEVTAIEQRHAGVQRPVDAGEHGLAVGPLAAHVGGCELHARVEVAEGEVHHRVEERHVDDLRRVRSVAEGTVHRA